MFLKWLDSVRKALTIGVRIGVPAALSHADVSHTRDRLSLSGSGTPREFRVVCVLSARPQFLVKMCNGGIYEV